MLGGLTSLSLPPLNCFFVNFFTLSILFIFLFKKLDDQNNGKFFFLYGWLFGLSYFLSNLYWITISLTFDPNFKFLIPVALILIPSFLGLFYGSATFIFYKFGLKKIIKLFFFIFPSFWTCWIFKRKYFNRFSLELIYLQSFGEPKFYKFCI